MSRDEKEFYPKPLDLALIGAAPRKFDAGEGVEVVALLVSGKPVAYRDLCPHMGGPLSAGTHEPRSGTLSCPWHGYEFAAATGAFVRNPNAAIFACMAGLYESHEPEKAPALALKKLELELRDGRAWVRR